MTTIRIEPTEATCDNCQAVGEMTRVMVGLGHAKRVYLCDKCRVELRERLVHVGRDTD